MAFKPYDPVAEHNARMQAQAANEWNGRLNRARLGMPSTSEMIVTKYMGHADVDPPIVVTVKTVTLENVGKKDDDEGEQRWFMWFHEHKKGFRLNVTTIRILEAAWGMHTDLWVGKRLKLWWDPTVLFGGKPVGGVKVRLPSAGGGGAAPPAGARFDPNTGKPLAPAPRFDPMTGKPLGAPTEPVARFDPQTGQPLTQTPAAQPAAAAAPATAPADEFGDPPATVTPGIDPDFDDDIPF